VVRAFHVAFPLLLAALILVSSLPEHRVPAALAPAYAGFQDFLRSLSLSQTWGMYAPNPSIRHAYPRLIAEDADGGTRGLRENELEAAGWEPVPFWRRTRMDIWRYQVGFRNTDRPNAFRTWYLRSICVREWREGQQPARITMEEVLRHFRSPDAVLRGSHFLSEPQIFEVESVDCRSRPVQAMIESDRARRERS
jgi:hypothetical protein